MKEKMNWENFRDRLGRYSYLVKIFLGESECPLAYRCSFRDDKSDACNRTRGRTPEIGNKIVCYVQAKAQARKEKKAEEKPGFMDRILSGWPWYVD